MAIADEEFAHLTVKATEEEIDAALAILNSLPEDQCNAMLAALGVETGNKRKGAEAWARAMKIVQTGIQYAPALAALL
jgi:hypothetical protein